MYNDRRIVSESFIIYRTPTVLPSTFNAESILGQSGLLSGFVSQQCCINSDNIEGQSGGI